MLIRCEKCSMSYELDDRLVPIGGAPVQCTRCSHVFIATRAPAMPNGTDLRTDHGPAHPSASSRPTERRTSVYGLPALAHPSSPEAASSVPPEAKATSARPAPVPFGGEPSLRASVKTAVFGVAVAPAAPPASATSEPPVEVSPERPPELPPVPTEVSSRAQADTEEEAAPAPSSPQRARIVSLPPPSHGGAAPPSVRALREARAPAPATATADDEVARALRAQLRRRRWLATIGLSLAVVGLGAVVFGRMLSGRAEGTPASVRAESERALTLIRRDDSAALQEATALLEGLVAQDASWVEPRAHLVLALSLRLDDARLALTRIEQESAALNRRIGRLRSAQERDWELRVNDVIDRIAGLKRAGDPLIEAARRLDDELGARFRSLPEARRLTPEQELSVVRAQAVYYGTKGSMQVHDLARRYDELTKGRPDGWAAVARAEYVANTRESRATIARARGGVEELMRQDTSFMRPYVLTARLLEQENRVDAAIPILEAVTALNPKHQVAQQLLERLSRQDNN